MSPTVDTLELLCPGSPVEIRILQADGKVPSRRFSDHAEARRWVESAPTARGVYVVMNPFDASRIDGKGVNDKSVTRRRWVLIDVDPTRPTNTNSTDAELASARVLAQAIRDYLCSLGWPEPVVCLSGNGWHLLFAIDLPNDELSHRLIKRLLAHLATCFDTTTVHVDTTVHNAARITKLYGTTARKGPSTHERPHRQSGVVSVPDPLVRVSLADLQRIADRTPEPPSESAPGERLYDIARILAKLKVYRTIQKDDTTYYEIQCPWAAGHSTQIDGPSGTVFTVRDDGAVGFKCQHNHCADKHWPELRAHLSIESSHRRVELIRAADVKVVKLDWLWHARLARGAITLFEGGPEKGKSTVLVDLAARVSLGHSFPQESATRPPSNVVMLIAEDDIQTTVVPRLQAAGADLDRIFFLGVTKNERGEIVPFHLSDDCDRLRAKCKEVEATFVVVDPLVSFLGSRKGRVLNTNNDLEVRKSLAPLKELAEHLRASVAAIRHYRKGNGTDAMEAGGGSVGFAALVRVIVAALTDPRADDDSHYLLAVAKNNLVAKTNRPAIAYEIVPWQADIDIGRIEWGEAVEMSAGEILMAQAESNRDSKGKAAEAKDFLEGFLREGKWVRQTELMKAAKEMQGLSEDAIRRAKAKLPIKVQKNGVHWEWMLDVPF